MGDSPEIGRVPTCSLVMEMTAVLVMILKHKIAYRTALVNIINSYIYNRLIINNSGRNLNNSYNHTVILCAMYVLFIYPDPPSWSPWNTWTTCECDGYSGKQSRSRTCIDLFPGDGDEECFGKDQESQACELDCTGKAIDVYYFTHNA